MRRPSGRAIVGAAWLAACGPADNGDDTGGDDTGTDISGAVVYHSMNRLAAEILDATPEYSGIDVALVSQEALLADVAAEPMTSTPLVTTGCSTQEGCTFSFDGTDLGASRDGVIVRLVDSRDEAIWLTTETNTMGPADIVAAEDVGTFTEARAFSVSHDALEVVLAPIVGLSAEELLARGFVFGLVYGEPGDGQDASGAPITGATVVPGRGYPVVYPNNTFTGAASATASQGAFVVFPPSVGEPLDITFAVSPPSGQVLTWDATRAVVLRPGVASFVALYAQ